MWPRLRVADWADTKDTLHMWTQIVGKVRMVQTPASNHWWSATLYVSPRGLTTSAIPYGQRTFDIEFDFIDHRLHIRTSEGSHRDVILAAKTVAQFYAETMSALTDLGLPTRIRAVPNEVDPAIPFAEDDRHATYDGLAAQLFWRQLLQVNRVLAGFRSGFVGKASPVHFFWGAMDLAYTRFSGRVAPPHPGGAPYCPDWVTREGYSHELASWGFWPGGGEEGAFYAYAYPQPAGYADHAVRPGAAYYDASNEFLLPYEVVASAPHPERVLMDFLDSTYAAAAELAHWDRAVLEADPHRLDQFRGGPPHPKTPD
jgi:hypothetical protein